MEASTQVPDDKTEAHTEYDDVVATKNTHIQDLETTTETMMGDSTTYSPVTDKVNEDENSEEIIESESTETIENVADLSNSKETFGNLKLKGTLKDGVLMIIDENQNELPELEEMKEKIISEAKTVKENTKSEDEEEQDMKEVNH